MTTLDQFAERRAKAQLGIAPQSHVACIHLGRTLESDAVRIDAVRRQYRDAVSRRLGLRLIRMNATTAVLIGAVVRRNVL